MIIQSLIKKIMRLSGNIQRGHEIYISPQNMEYFAEQLSGIDAQQGILITPYLIIEGSSIYELHYYEFDIEVRNEASHFNDYAPKNSLPDEITENLKPQAIIVTGDTKFYQESVSWYLKKMQKMKFSDVKSCYPEFQNSHLFYQIIIDSDL